ncbi:MAG: radical SAM protein [Spirochaetaceae bacterium]|nr:MAG: radical SAM protein [Spirochaetaceae bacterium]
MNTTLLKTLTGVGILTVFLAIGLHVRIGNGAIHAGRNAGQTRQTNQANTNNDTVPKSNSPFVPAYMKLHESGELAKRAQELWSMLESCNLCPRNCGVNRLAGERGYCRAPGSDLVIASVQPHFGEERPLVGQGGSGTIFFSHCNLRCVFCQNYQISILGRGNRISVEQLANAMLELQQFGAHNINVVTPTHFTPHIVAAIDIAAGRGLRLPIVWNTSGWEHVEVIQLLDGIVDIYLPDIKFAYGEDSQTYADSPTYPEQTKQAVLEMHRQVGVAHPGAAGIVNRGLMIRHLVMPDNAGGSKQVLDWIATNLPADTYINIMEQYSPHHEAFNYPRIARRTTAAEYQSVVNYAQELGLSNLDSRAARWLNN